MSGQEVERDAPRFEWDIVVRTWNHYGDRVVQNTPATIQASTKAGVTSKVRVAFDAKYDGFRKFWSHDWTLKGVREITPLPPEAGEQS